MRVTNSIITSNAVAALQANLSRVNDTQTQVSSGLRFRKSSEDPAAAAGVMRTDGSLRALEQYKRNIGQATLRVKSEESALDQLTDVLSRASELAVSQAGDTASASTRLVTKSEVDSLLDHAVALGNTKVGDDFIFGGVHTNVAPFDAAAPGFTPVPINASDETLVEVSSSQQLKSTHNGAQVFLSTGALAALKKLSVALGANDGASIASAGTDLRSALDGVQDVLGDVGARSNQLQMTTANIGALDTNLRAFKSDLQEIDIEKSLTELVSRQTAYQAAMLATSKVLGMTLTNYLR